MKLILSTLLISAALSACNNSVNSQTQLGDLQAAVSGTYQTTSEATLDEVSARARSFLRPPDYEVAYTGDLGYSGKRLEIHYRQQPLFVAIKIPQAKFEYAVLVFDLSNVPDVERRKLIALIRSYLIPDLEQQDAVGRQVLINSPSLGANNSFKPSHICC